MGGACMPSGGVFTMIRTGHFRIDKCQPKHPNARFDIVLSNGNLFQQYWTDHLGGLMHRRDHTNHGNAKQHPIVPHDHDMSTGDPNTPAIPVDNSGRFC